MHNRYDTHHGHLDEFARYGAACRSNTLVAQLVRSRPWWNADRTALLLLGLGLVYLVVREPLLVATVSSAGLFFYCLSQVVASVPSLNRIVGAKIRFWHVATAIATLAATLSLFELPAQAIFLSGLEQFLTQIAQQSSTGGAGGAVSPQAIKLVFNAIRAIFLLLVGVAALFAYNQSQQGNDWRPIATQAGLALGVVLTIDVITFLFVGNGTGTGP